jgi:hypothetical protein
MGVIEGKKARGLYKVDKYDIERGMLHCNSIVQLAEYLGINRLNLVKHMKDIKGEGDRTLYEIFSEKIKNVGRGYKTKLDREFLTYLLEFGVLGNKMPPSIVKDKLLDEGYLPKECMCCGFGGHRDADAKYPLLLNFLDGKRSSWKKENLEILCYNCYFIKVGDLMFKDQLEALEFYGDDKRKKVYNSISSEVVYQQAKAYKEEMDKIQEEFNNMDEWANDIVAFSKFKK